MKNPVGRGGCYPPRPKTEVDNILLALLFIPNMFRRLFGILTLSLSNWATFSSLKLLKLLATIFGLTKITQSRPHQRFNNLQRAALLTSLIQYDRPSFQIWGTTAGYGELCVWFQPIRNREIF